MLPIRRVVLFKHGVGYFERQGEVEGETVLDLHFKASEMNDVLKSLTVLDLGGGLVSSINYESACPIEKQLEEIAIRLPDENTLTGLLAQIKGAPVAIETGERRVEGVLTGIETITRQGPVVETCHRVAILVDGRSLQTYDLFELKSVTLLGEGLRRDLSYLLDSLISSRNKDLKRLTIFAHGAGCRSLTASYTIETPVWKTSYRLLLGDGAPLLQGWALVDNTQDEDWEKVSLELVAGLPISFAYDLYSLHYKRRPVVEVAKEGACAPPVLETAGLAGAAPELLGEERRADRMAEPVATHAAPGMMASPAPQVATAVEPSLVVSARAVEAGDLFRYEIENPVTVKRNQSALVPIVQKRIEGRRVAVYNPEVREKNPMSAVLLKNTSGMVLEGGPVSVLEGGSYVGEAMLETLHAAEERLVPFSVELGCTVTIDHSRDLKDVHRTRIVDGRMWLHRYRIDRKVYVIASRTVRPIELYLEHRFHPGWDLFDTPAPKETTDHFRRFKIDVPANQTIRFTVSERGDEQESFALTTIQPDQLEAWIKSRMIEPAVRTALIGIVQLARTKQEIEQRLADLDGEIKELVRDQARQNQNLQAVGKTQTWEEQSLRERYVSALSSTEDKLGDLRTRVKELKKERPAADEKIREAIGRLRYEWSSDGTG